MKTMDRRRGTVRAIGSTLLVTAILGAYAFPLAMPTLAQTAAAQAGPGPDALDVDPETASGPIGTTFTLTATVYEGGQVFAGPGTDTHVRFYFVPGSPNDPPSGL